MPSTAIRAIFPAESGSAPRWRRCSSADRASSCSTNRHAAWTPSRKRALIATLHQLRDDGVAILLATHDVELVAEVASRVVLLGDGRIVADGGPRTVLSGSLTFTTAVNKLYGDGFLTPGDILTGLAM